MSFGTRQLFRVFVRPFLLHARERRSGSLLLKPIAASDLFIIVVSLVKQRKGVMRQALVPCRGGGQLLFQEGEGN